MPESRMNEVAQELWQQTKAGKVDWERTRSEDAYRVVFPDVMLRISRQALTGPRVVSWEISATESFDYQLDVHDDAGRVIGSLAPAHEDSMHELLAELFQLAERHVRFVQQASGIDKALDYLKRS